MSFELPSVEDFPEKKSFFEDKGLEEEKIPETENHLKGGEILKKEKGEQGDREYLIKYMEALDKVEDEVLSFLDGARLNKL